MESGTSGFPPNGLALGGPDKRARKTKEYPRVYTENRRERDRDRPRALDEPIAWSTAYTVTPGRHFELEVACFR